MTIEEARALARWAVDYVLKNDDELARDLACGLGQVLSGLLEYLEHELVDELHEAAALLDADATQKKETP